jgi:hypothetical protein
MAAVLVIGLFVALIGGVGVVAPQVLQGISRYTVTPLGLYLASAFRIFVGVALVRGAAASRAPGLLRVLGFIAIGAGIVTLLLGVARAREIVNWWLGQGPVLIRLWPGIALGFGVFLVWAAAPRRRAA